MALFLVLILAATYFYPNAGPHWEWVQWLAAQDGQFKFYLLGLLLIAVSNGSGRIVRWPSSK